VNERSRGVTAPRALEGFPVKDRYLSAAVLGFGIIYTIAAWNLPRAPVGNPLGPVYFPLVLGLFIALIGFLMLLQSLKAHHEEHAAKSGRYAIRILTVLAFCVAYALMFNRIGFLFSSFVFLSALLILLNGFKKWLMNFSISILYTVGIWYLFEKVFLINLP